MPGQKAELADGRRQPQQIAALPALLQPPQRRPQVAELDFQVADVGSTANARSDRRGAGEAPIRMAVSGDYLIAARRQAFERELADRFEHRVAGLSRLVVPLEQALVDQRRHPVDGIDCRAAVHGDHFDRREGATAGKDAKPSEEGLLGRRQEVVAPGDRAPYRPVPIGQIVGAAGEETETIGQVGEQGRGRERAHPRGGELDGQGKSVQAAHDLGHLPPVIGGEGKALVGGTGTLDEELDRAVGDEVWQRERANRRGNRQWWDWVEVLARHMEDGAASCQDGQVWAGGEQAAKLRAGRGQVFQVIEAEEHPATAERGGQALDLGGIAKVPDVQCLGDAREEQVPVGEGGEPDEVGAAWEVSGGLCRSGDGDPGLTDAAGAGQGDDGDIGASEEVDHRCHVPVAPQERRPRGRQWCDANRERNDGHVSLRRVLSEPLRLSVIAQLLVRCGVPCGEVSSGAGRAVDC